MTYKFLYPDVIAMMRDQCKRLIKGEGGIDELQHAALTCERTIVAYEERNLRTFFFNIENKLEHIRFMVPEHKQASEVAKVANEILQYLNEVQ